MAEDKEELSYEDKKKFCSVISKPLAEEKLAKKILKLAKKAAKRKQILRGVKQVVKAIRKNQKGQCGRSFCILAGDTSPIDAITHVPVICEDNDIPYIYLPSKQELGASALSKRGAACLLVVKKPLKEKEQEGQQEYEEAYSAVFKKVKASQIAF